MYIYLIEDRLRILYAGSAADFDMAELLAELPVIPNVANIPVDNMSPPIIFSPMKSPPSVGAMRVVAVEVVGALEQHQVVGLQLVAKVVVVCLV